MAYLESLAQQLLVQHELAQSQNEHLIGELYELYRKHDLVISQQVFEVSPELAYDCWDFEHWRRNLTTQFPTTAS